MGNSGSLVSDDYTSKSASTSLSSLTEAKSILFLGKTRNTVANHLQYVNKKTYVNSCQEQFKHDIRRLIIARILEIFSYLERNSNFSQLHLTMQYLSEEDINDVASELKEFINNDRTREICHKLYSPYSPKHHHVAYYFSQIERICDPDFVPNAKDILFYDNPGKGLQDFDVTIFNDGTVSLLRFILLESLNHNSARLKEKHSDLSMVVYCVDISKFDSDKAISKALELFTANINQISTLWKDTPIIVVFTKKDVLESNLNYFFFPSLSDFSGEDDIAGAIEHLTGIFGSRNIDKKSKLKGCYAINCLSTSDVESLSSTINSILRRKAKTLRKSPSQTSNSATTPPQATITIRTSRKSSARKRLSSMRTRSVMFVRDSKIRYPTTSLSSAS